MVFLDRSGKIAAVALERGCVVKHAMWQLGILDNGCSSLAFDGSVLASNGYDTKVGVVLFGGEHME